jgi:hypothetical protein
MMTAPLPPSPLPSGPHSSLRVGPRWVGAPALVLGLAVIPPVIAVMAVGLGGSLLVVVIAVVLAVRALQAPCYQGDERTTQEGRQS